MVITYSITSSSHNSIVFLLSVTFILQYYYKRFKQGSQYLFSNLLKNFSAQMFARDPIRARMFVLVRSGRSGPARECPQKPKICSLTKEKGLCDLFFEPFYHFTSGTNSDLCGVFIPLCEFICEFLKFIHVHIVDYNLFIDDDYIIHIG